MELMTYAEIRLNHSLLVPIGFKSGPSYVKHTMESLLAFGC